VQVSLRYIFIAVKAVEKVKVTSIIVKIMDRIIDGSEMFTKTPMHEPSRTIGIITITIWYSITVEGFSGCFSPH
jgi:hypothetical protein